MKAGNETTTREYQFTYDDLSRMLSATYGEGTSIGSNANRFTEKVTSYDKNGNIKALQRYGQTSASAYGLIDNLTYTLDGNWPTRVDDAVSASAYNNGFEFKDGAKTANEYAYDANGNLTKDLNRNITEIQYNFLNLPSKVTFSDGNTIEYVYAADGTKLRTVHTIGGTTTTTDYCGDVIYENGVRKYVLTEEGYVALNESNKYYYYLKDHQGNNRVVVSSDGAVEEVNHYYPFGGVFASTSSVQPYKYNGKELDTKKGLNWYDYGARMYDPSLGRFTTMDPMAEEYYSLSPYAYCLNDPVRHIDPSGEKIVDVNGNIIYTKEKGWLVNAPQDAVRLGNAMLKTSIGKTQFYKMVDAEHGITLSINPNEKIEETSEGIRKYTLGQARKNIENDKLKSVDIIVYEGTLKNYLEKATTSKSDLYRVSTQNIDEAIGAVATHESVHATDKDNIRDSYENIVKGASHDVEKLPNEVERTVLRELFNKKQKLENEIFSY